MWLQDGAPAEEDLQAWGQHSSTDTVPDRVMQSIGAELPGQVSFVFACKVSLLLLSSWHPSLPSRFNYTDALQHLHEYAPGLRACLAAPSEARSANFN